MKKLVVVLMAVVAAATAAVLAFSGGGSVGGQKNGPSEKSEKVSASPRKKIASVKPTRVIRTKPMLELSDDDGVKKTPEEKRLAEAIEKALDEEDLDLAKSCAQQAVNCRVSEIRQAMVDTLGWFGQKALVELLPFMADADEDVARSRCRGAVATAAR